ncbi:MAG: DUF3168 domain-containing protein [Hyphomicrobiaceae bacterium]
MPSSAWSLQQAIYTTVTTDPDLLALLGTPRIYDDVSQSAPHPYLTLGQSITRDWSSVGDTGEEHLLTLHVWSRASGRKETHQIMSALRDALHDRPLTLTSHRLVNLRHEFSDARREPDGETYHGVVHLRAVTEPL